MITLKHKKMAEYGKNFSSPSSVVYPKITRHWYKVSMMNATENEMIELILILKWFHFMERMANPNTMKAIPTISNDQADMVDSYSCALSKMIRMNHPIKIRTGAKQ